MLIGALLTVIGVLLHNVGSGAPSEPHTLISPMESIEHRAGRRLWTVGVAVLISGAVVAALSMLHRVRSRKGSSE